jgi:nucleotide-binding universal stress UspA family protein
MRPESAGHDVVIGQGSDWESALNDVDWHDGDLLVVGSSESGPVARVFVGSRAAKIIRHTPVPALVVPRGVAEK